MNTMHTKLETAEVFFQTKQYKHQNISSSCTLMVVRKHINTFRKSDKLKTKKWFKVASSTQYTHTCAHVSAAELTTEQ